jgi:hypothetical protein
MLPQCLRFAFALTFCFQLTEQNYHADNRARFVESLSAAAVEGEGATYLDLLEEVFPGVEASGGDQFTLKRTVRLRNLERPREVTERAGVIEISTVQSLWLVHAGEHHLALVVNARHEGADGVEEFYALAVFAPQTNPRLVDAAEIDFDRFTGFWEESPLLPVRQGETAFWLRASHHNSSEGFHTYHLAELRGGRLRLALADPFGLTDVKLCGSETSETLKVVRERGVFAGRRMFDLSVRTETKPTGDCEGARPIRRRVTVRTHRLRWDARRQTYRTAATIRARAGRRG